MIKTLIKFVAIPLLIIGLLFWGRIQWFASQDFNNEESVVFEVASGDTLYGVVNHLKEQNLIDCASCARWWLRLSNKPNLTSGEYEIEPGTSFKELMALFKKQDVLQYRVTLVEGWTLKQALNAIWKKPKIKKTLTSDDPVVLLKELDFLSDYKNQRHADGLFFPATYAFKKGMTDVDILKQAHQKMQTVLEAEWENRASSLPYKNAYEAMIMASIIEKETGVAGERDQIAGVFVRRLQKGMKLQTDPTVIYGMGDRYDGNIRRRDLRESTDYNTYVIYGLPPTPIALAGKEAIHAALNPAKGTSLYFVASGDGGHVFSDTLAEHNRAVQQYLRKLRSRS